MKETHIKGRSMTMTLKILSMSLTIISIPMNMNLTTQDLTILETTLQEIIITIKETVIIPIEMMTITVKETVIIPIEMMTIIIKEAMIIPIGMMIIIKIMNLKVIMRKYLKIIPKIHRMIWMVCLRM